MENLNIKIKKLFGIYLIFNKINSKVYIGKSKNLYNRIMEHKRAKTNSFIHRAIKKDGWNNFRVEILAEFEQIDNLELLALETAFIEHFNSTNKDIGYNICLFATDTTGIKHTKETKRKMSLNHSKFMTGKHHSKQTKNKMSLMCKLQKHCFKPKMVKQIDKHTGKLIKIWHSILDASSQLNIKSTNIVSVCRNRIHKGSVAQTCGGFKWEYFNNKEAPLALS